MLVKSFASFAASPVIFCCPRVTDPGTDRDASKSLAIPFNNSESALSALSGIIFVS